MSCKKILFILFILGCFESSFAIQSNQLVRNYEFSSSDFVNTEISNFFIKEYYKRNAEKRSKVHFTNLKSQLYDVFSRKNHPLQDSCEVIIFSNGDKQLVEIVELTNNVIKYRRCGMPDGPLLIKTIDDLYKIKYATGENKIINKDNDPAKNEEVKEKADEKTVHDAFAVGFLFGFLFNVFGLLDMGNWKTKVLRKAYFKGWLTGLIVLITIFALAAAF
jgi:hypothetical protein